MGRSAEQFVAGQLVPGTKYRTRSLLGSGGMGSVYEVEHTELGKLFVLKVLRASLVERTDLVARMRNEWRALGRLQHPNIVAVTDAGITDDGVPFFVMERLEGETLATRLRRDGRLSVPLAMRISVGLLEALAAAHAINVVHRDIKPQNVFLPACGGVKLLDFGVAKLHDRDRDAPVVTVRGVALGTPRYMSPEQAEGKTVDGRADTYAVALVLFEMIAGKGPFAHRRDPNELVLAHISETPARLDAESEAPPELADLVQRWLSKAPEDRPADATAAAKELRGLLGRYTFDARGADPTNEPTAHADYDASTQAGAPRDASLRGGAPRGRTLSLGTAQTALDESATHAEGPRRGGQKVATSGQAVRTAAPDEAEAARGGDTQIVTGTLTPADAPTTRTVLPAPGGQARAELSRAESAPRRPSQGATSEGHGPRSSRRRDHAARSETPPPVEPPRPLPERPWLRMTGVAAAAALASFAASVLLGQTPPPAAPVLSPAEARSSNAARQPAEGPDAGATATPRAPAPQASGAKGPSPAPASPAALPILTPAPQTVPAPQGVPAPETVAQPAAEPTKPPVSGAPQTTSSRSSAAASSSAVRSTQKKAQSASASASKKGTKGTLTGLPGSGL